MCRVDEARRRVVATRRLAGARRACEEGFVGVAEFGHHRARYASTASFAPTSAAFWDIFVPSSDLEKARALVEQALAELDSIADDAARAAEDEALSSGEKTPG